MSLAHIEPEQPARLLAISDIAQAVDLAERICRTNFVPTAYRGKPEETLACILYGNELGVGPMQSLNGIDVIQGTPFLRAQLVQALVRSHGGRIDVEESTDDRAVVLAQRPGWSQPRAVEFTIAEAQRQGLLNKDQWKKDPKGMLVNRATTRAGRWFFSDVLRGMAQEGEDVDWTPPAPDAQPATEPVETHASIAAVAQRKLAELPETQTNDEPAEAKIARRGQGRPQAEVLAELDEARASVALDGDTQSLASSDHRQWDRRQWTDAVRAAGLTLPDLGRAYGVRNYDSLANASDEMKDQVHATLLAGTVDPAPTLPIAEPQYAPDEEPF